jgi:hypothetical protein
MPNPALINEQSPKILHFLGIADIYMTLGRPAIYEVEPKITDEYQPDAYTRLTEGPAVVELQRSTISTKKFQNKVDLFVEAYRRNKHDARTLLVYSDKPYNITLPSGFRVEQRKLEVI